MFFGTPLFHSAEYTKSSAILAVAAAAAAAATAAATATAKAATAVCITIELEPLVLIFCVELRELSHLTSESAAKWTQTTQPEFDPNLTQKRVKLGSDRIY